MYKRRRHGLQDSSHPDHSIQSMMQIFVSREKKQPKSRKRTNQIGFLQVVFGIFAAAAALPSSYVHVEVPAEPYIHQEVPGAFISFIILMFSIVIFNVFFLNTETPGGFCQGVFWQAIIGITTIFIIISTIRSPPSPTSTKR